MVAALVTMTGKETLVVGSTSAEVIGDDSTGAGVVEEVDDAESAEGRVEVAVMVLLAMVLVRVMVEVKYDVVVGSAPAPPPSSAASDARGKDSRTEVRRMRILAKVS